MRFGLLQRPVQIILVISMVRMFLSILEVYYVIVYLTLCFLSPHIYSVDNTIRYWEAGKLPTLQDSAGLQTKKIDRNIEVTSGTYCNFLMSAGGECVAGLQIIVDLGIVSKLDT